MVLGSLDQIEIWEPDAFRANEEAGRAEIAGSEIHDTGSDA
jgi:DNA-binding transcriptional regulator/RsmH inhibitor MraZ